MLCDDFHQNSGYSAEDSVVLFIHKKEFLEELDKKKEIAIDLMKFLCFKINKTEANIPQIIH